MWVYLWFALQQYNHGTDNLDHFYLIWYRSGMVCFPFSITQSWKGQWQEFSLLLKVSSKSGLDFIINNCYKEKKTNAEL